LLGVRHTANHSSSGILIGHCLDRRIATAAFDAGRYGGVDAVCDLVGELINGSAQPQPIKVFMMAQSL